MPLIIIAIIALIVLGIIKRSPKAKGKIGEARVASKLGETIPDRQYVINNLLFTDESGNSCQIDHILINFNGLWVVETKNYSGKIYGNSNQHEWVQILGKGSSKIKFYNPVKQNASHIYHLSKQLNKTNIFHNVVCFLHADISHVDSDCVYYPSQLENIKTLPTGITLSLAEMQEYYNKLSQLSQNSNITTESHVQNIKQTQSKINQGICPRCGGQLVLRHGKYGGFYGCSSYPKCKFTKNSK